MKILIHSTLFPPSVGGMETVMRLLVNEFLALGHTITVSSNTKFSSEDLSNVKWIPAKNYLALICESFKSDLILQANIGIPSTWLLFITKPSKIYVVHHTWYRGEKNKIRFRDRLKLFTTRFLKNISVSQAIADHLPVSSTVIHNPFDFLAFAKDLKQERKKDLVFVGRLVSDKGAVQLLEAFSKLPDNPTLSIIGDGEECEKLLDLRQKLSLESRVEFLGTLTGQELAKQYQQHKILVIPSTWDEPFGVVGLEALASGCRVLAADRPGLREALGSNAVYFEPKNIESFVSALNQVLSESKTADVNNIGYLERFKPNHVVKQYIALFSK